MDSFSYATESDNRIVYVQCKKIFRDHLSPNLFFKWETVPENRINASHLYNTLQFTKYTDRCCFMIFVLFCFATL